MASVAVEDPSDLMAASGTIEAVDWVQSLDVLRPARDEICRLLGLEPPVSVARTTTAAATTQDQKKRPSELSYAGMCVSVRYVFTT